MTRAVAEPVLTLTGLNVRFGGTKAVTDLNLTVGRAEVVGLIGPNGAGKSTTLNACAGGVRVSGGRVTLHDADVTGWSIARRARNGLGRTFQRFALCDSLSTRTNVALGAEARDSGGAPWRCLSSSASHRRMVRAQTEEALALCRLEHLADRTAGSLSTGQRRLVELARVICGGFDVLLLDEPSSGLDPAETEAFAEILNVVVTDMQRSMLLVEHDMTLIRAACDYVHVIDFGVPLTDGEPDAVLSDPLVRRAYLGEEVGELTHADGATSA